MKKILWVCNTMLPELFGRFHTYNVKEGWLVGISNEIRKQSDIEFHYACPQTKEKRIVNIKKGSINFHCFYAKYDNSYAIEDCIKDQIGKILSEIKPDVIHIFGTEMPHAAACVECAGQKEKIIISIQGLVSEYVKHYLNGIPHQVYREGVFSNGRYQTILSQYREFGRRAENEIKALRGVKHIIGRTDWDRACVGRINKRCIYHYCNETLRDCFYGKKWDIDRMNRYTILVSQGDYPIKGLHNLLYALPGVIEKYPETMVYIAGTDSFLKEKNPYGLYIKKEIARKNLGGYIRFLGMIDAETMCKYLLKSHVAVMPSNIENSPNSVGEAMVLGTPVVASFVGGIPSMIQDGKEGLLYQSDSVKMLSYNICRIFGRDCETQQLSANARKKAEVLYDREKNLRQLLAIYDCM